MARSSSPSGDPGDSVDRLLHSWSQADPDLDLSPVAIVARLGRLRRIIDAELEATFAQHGLNGPDFAALVTLRRLEQAGGVPQSQLQRELNITSGTISVRVERLCSRGLAQRSPDPADHRNSRISLTEAGLRLFEQVTPAHVATENRLLAALNPGQREQLADLLRQLLVSFEGSTADGDAPRLGLVLAPAHVTIEVRRAAGLPDVVGLLVRETEPDAPAAHAGIKVGDVLVKAEAHELHSVTALHAAAKQAKRTGTLHVTVVRGAKTKTEIAIDVRHSPADGDPSGRTTTADAALHTL
ncbi:MAG TPA: MarR family transcriptional regulator [Pseudonocardiaceae bacterium]|nr:MarR family transcriptional regulator [Pseudonocardiaceae bacterium]